MIPLYSSDQVRKADSYAINHLKIPSIALMENASRSIYQITLAKFPELNPNYKIGIVCGKGNNGGDGFALARHFINDGYNVKVIAISKGNDFASDAKTNFNILQSLVKNNTGSSIIYYKSVADINKLKNCYLVFDALLGTGAKGTLREPYTKIVTALNKHSFYRIAIDSPTGLDLETSTGDTIFDADLTITLAELKNGLFYGKGYVNSGEVEKGYIGIGEEYFANLSIDNYVIEPEDAFINIPVKKVDSHKYSAGKVLTIAGSGKLPGAAAYTANTAIYSGAGASILAFPSSIEGIAQIKLESSIVDSYDDDGSEFLRVQNIDELKSRIEWADSIAIGPGLGRESDTVDAVRKVISLFSNKRLVLDADALYAIAKKYYRKLNLKNVVLTPHHGEFAALLDITVSELQSDLLKYGKKFSSETGAYLVLKGAPTIVFTPGGDALINTAGNPGMATFGTGDVLTGIISAFISQSDNIEGALISSVYIHSLAADLLLELMTEHGITAGSIMKNIPSTIKFLEDSFVKSTA